MPGSTALLHSYLQGIRTLSDAGSISLFVPASLRGGSQPLLLHSGELDSTPELEDLEKAQSYVDALDLDKVLTHDVAEQPVLVPSADPDSGLIPLLAFESSWGLPTRTARGPARRKTDARPRPPKARATAWLGLRYAPGRGSALLQFFTQHLFRAVSQDTYPQGWWNWIFSLGGALAGFTTQISALLRDPITGLAGRQQFQAAMIEQLEESLREHSFLAILLVNPDNFAAINDRHGREVGDRCVQEIAERLRVLFRDSDLLSRYGGVIFAASLELAAREQAEKVARRIAEQLTRKPFLEGTLSLEFSIGLSVFDATPGGVVPDPQQLVRQADQALSTAKRRGGGQVVSWSEELKAEQAGSFDRLSGIFTGNMTTDYRHMALLWESANLIAREADFEALGGQLVESMYEILDLRQVGLFLCLEEDELELVRGLARVGPGNPLQRLDTVDVNDLRREMLLAAVKSGEVQHETLPSTRHEAAPAQEALCCAIPLLASQRTLGCLYLEGPEDSGSLASSSLDFLRALGSQVAVAMDRARLSELESRRREREQRSLRSELKVLRKAGIIEQRIDKQRRMYSVRPQAVEAISAWTMSHREFWQTSLNRLEQALMTESNKR